MVLEIAEFHAQPGKAAELQAGLQAGRRVIQQAQGCHAVTLRRQIEDPDTFILEIEWETLEAHTVMFRGGPLFPEYRSHISGLFTDPVVVRHYQQIPD